MGIKTGITDIYPRSQNALNIQDIKKPQAGAERSDPLQCCQQLSESRQTRNRTTKDSAMHTSRPQPSPEWLAARNQYIDHLMACRACHAPTSRHCATGQTLRQQYDNTPESSAVVTSDRRSR